MVHEPGSFEMIPGAIPAGVTLTRECVTQRAPRRALIHPGIVHVTTTTRMPIDCTEVMDYTLDKETPG